ncbi:MAG TPA: ABC transporter permease, partial [Acidobacteriota bacterium]
MSWTFRMSAAIAALLMFAVLIAPVLAPAPYNQINLADRLLPPSSLHWMGTDELGRDIFARILYGGRVSFVVSIVVVGLCFFIGVSIGSFCGFLGGWVDEIMMRIGDLLLAFPGILLAIGLMAVLGPSLQNVILALVIIGWVSTARLARGLTLRLRELDFVAAARNLGASPLRLLRFHIVPNMLPPLIVQASFAFAGVLLAESSLSFLGLGVQPPTPSWGNMLSEGKNHLLDAPLLTLFPGSAIFLSVLVFNLMGDGLQDQLAPRF